MIREQKKARKGFSVSPLFGKIKLPTGVSSRVKNVLDGSFLAKESFLHQAPFLFYVLVLAFIYIAVNYYADKTLIKIEKTKDQIKELRFEYVTSKTDLTLYTQASNILGLLEDEGLKRSLTPPRKIFIHPDED